jgi:hypothetical protein
MGRLPRRSIKVWRLLNEWDTQDKKIEEPINEETTRPDYGTQTTQVWRKKTTPTSTPQEEHASDSSSGSDDAPEQ